LCMGLRACLCGFGLLEVVGCAFCGVGLSLNSYRSISVAPVRGGTYFLCRGVQTGDTGRKESKQRKRPKPLILKRVSRAVAAVVHLESVFSHIPPRWPGRHSSGGAARAVAVFMDALCFSVGFAFHRSKVTRRTNPAHLDASTKCTTGSPVPPAHAAPPWHIPCIAIPHDAAAS
jgi:hypothetical protein